MAVWRRSRIDAVPALEARLGHSLHDDRQYFLGSVVPDYEVWVAETDGLVVGMLAIRGDDLDKLYVDPDHQRRGIGTLLLERAKNLSPSGLTLFTHQVNSKARSFYEANGFEAIRFGISPPPENEPDVQYRWMPRRSGNAA
ncbi:GNAT family N-acetyltransferase [Myxococcota bacterium]|nr:GNAT family N-acetyltransferase [Myxococcota bacterium]